MDPPNEAQQRAFAYALKPFAASSFLSACYVLFYLVFQRPEKRKRMYHRIILAMNACVVPYAVADFVGTWAMPAGTPHRVGAAGSRATCTAQGFVSVVFYMTVLYYYASLSVFSCVAVKNSFREEQYKWIEKWIHLGAVCVSLPWAVIAAARGSINAHYSVCWIGEYPHGCHDDPSVPCERGDDRLSWAIEFVCGWASVVIYFIIPPVALIVLRASIQRVNRDVEQSVGKRKMIESARKTALHDVTSQATLYLFSFWGTQITNIISAAYEIATGKPNYNLAIVGVCLSGIQGVVLMLVYFRLEAKKTRTVQIEGCHKSLVKTQSLGMTQTVADIREAATNPNRRRRSSPLAQLVAAGKCSFHIFDGEPDPSSPWAKFLDPDFDDGGDDAVAIKETHHFADDDDEE